MLQIAANDYPEMQSSATPERKRTNGARFAKLLLCGACVAVTTVAMTNMLIDYGTVGTVEHEIKWAAIEQSPSQSDLARVSVAQELASIR